MHPQVDTIQGNKCKVIRGKSCPEGSEKLVKILRERGIIFIISAPRGVIQPLLLTSTAVRPGGVSVMGSNIDEHEGN